MLSLLRASALTAGTLLLVCQAKAESAPTDTATFISYCSEHFVICRDAVRSHDNINRMTKMGIMNGKRRCTFPKTEAAGGRLLTREEAVRDSTAATKAILAWLTANGATRTPKTEDAIEQAEKSLWPANCV